MLGINNTTGRFSIPPVVFSYSMVVYSSSYQPSVTSSSSMRFLFIPYTSGLPARIVARCFSATVCIVGFIYVFLIIAVSSFLLFVDEYLFTIHDVQTLGGVCHLATLQVVDLSIAVSRLCLRHLDARHIALDGEELTCPCAAVI